MAGSLPRRLEIGRLKDEKKESRKKKYQRLLNNFSKKKDCGTLSEERCLRKKVTLSENTRLCMKIIS